MNSAFGLAFDSYLHGIKIKKILNVDAQKQISDLAVAHIHRIYRGG